MKKITETIIKRFTIVSRIIFLSVFLSGILSGVNAEVITHLDMKWTWLGIIGILLLRFGTLMLILSWITPGILVALGVPELAHAWLRGINPILISSTSWVKLSYSEKIFVYFYSIGISVITLFFIVGFYLYSIRR